MKMHNFQKVIPFLLLLLIFFSCEIDENRIEAEIDQSCGMAEYAAGTYKSLLEADWASIHERGLETLEYQQFVDTYQEEESTVYMVQLSHVLSDDGGNIGGYSVCTVRYFPDRDSLAPEVSHYDADGTFEYRYKYRTEMRNCHHEECDTKLRKKFGQRFKL